MYRAAIHRRRACGKYPVNALRRVHRATWEISYMQFGNVRSPCHGARPQHAAMHNIRRIDPQGRPVFITQACKGGKPLLLGLECLVLAVMQELRREAGWKVHAHVILPDHMHLILGGDGGFSRFMQSMKLRVVRRAGCGRFWQNRFHDHVIRNELDLRNHLDYLHYNPVRHGHALTPESYAYSSFRQYQARGLYVSGWGHSAPDSIAAVAVEA